MFPPRKEMLRKMHVVSTEKMFATRKIFKLKKKKRQDKSNLLLCCPTLLYEITTVMKDAVIMHAAKQGEFKYCWEFLIPSL